MADAKALGGALAYNPLIAPSVQSKLLEAQQQQAIASALLGDGMSPLDTKDRQIGGVGYAISPLEGLGKLAQALSGRYQLSQANKDYMSAFQPDGSQGTSGGQGGGILSQQGASILQGVPPNLQPLVASWATTEPRAAAELIAKFAAPTEQQKNFGGQGNPAFQSWVQNQTNPGAVKYQEALGANAAGNAPAGQLPPGMNPMMGNLVSAESAGNPNAVSRKGAGGLTQIMPATASDPGFGVQPLQGWDGVNPSTAPPQEQLRFGNDYLNAMQARNGGNPQLAAASYNAGPGAVDRAGIGSSGPQQTISRLPAETQAYVPKVSGAMPAPMQGESQNQYMARLDASKAGATAQAGEIGKATGEAVKGASTIDSRFDNSQQILSEMHRLAARTSGGPMANIMEPIHRGLNDQTSGDNAAFENLAANQLTTALAPIVQGVGGRIDIPLMRAIQEAESVRLTDSQKGKERAIDNLSKMLEVQRQNAHNQVNSLTGQPLAQNPAGAALQSSGGSTHRYNPSTGQLEAMQ